MPHALLDAGKRGLAQRTPEQTSRALPVEARECLRAAVSVVE